ncbi:myosin light chain kinase A-like [Sitodiplosis mosellana]|uniref:myosin light chain kinase A-like n=1 Tax=Sitodiplosis mosellana TaxID=263140 RepID=UPI002443D6FF|nr:myosin light chain kinase A-like [Sitodiplosis mosellana]
MCDDDEMTDLSQANTEGPDSQLSTDPSIGSSGQIETKSEPFGRITISKIMRRRYGTTRQVVRNKASEQIFILDLVKERTTFGRKGDCSVSDYIHESKINEISGIHFSIVKTDVNNALCPIFIEDSSMNGTYVRQKISDTNERTVERIDEKIKRRILAHNDQILIERCPTICFEFQSFQLVPNDLPADINADYHIGKELGRGACGVVNFVQNRRTCKFYALKITRNENEKSISTMMREVDILKKLNHPCILHLHKVKSYTDSVAILIDYMEGGDLFTRIRGCGHFSENFSKFIFYQICCGVAHLHEQKVTHRDLKPENILLSTADKYTLVKVADFGLSKCTTFDSVLKTQCGTVHYLAPEVRQGTQYTNKVDIWSIGVILYNCLTGLHPSVKDSRGNHLINRTESVWNDVTEDAQNIIRETLQVKATERPSAKTLLEKRNWLSKENPIVRQAIQTIENPTNK